MKKLVIEAFKFFGLSGIGWLLDFSTYTIFGLFSNNIIINNIISSWVGVTFVFICATKNIFKKRTKIPLNVKYFIYILYQCILIIIISRLLNWINESIAICVFWGCLKRVSHIISKVLVTPITMILNYIVMKTVMEKL